ncbi:MAG: UvrB domain 3-containing protein, partial [Planctomycetaceae bacterium]
EAHSSQTGEAASKLKLLLSAEEQQELADGGALSNEDILAASMSGRVADSGITYVAFTATPKAKTLELFGRRPDPAKPAGPGNLPGPFHVYSMRQAIEERFILDVLRNYTSYKLAFKLANGGQVVDGAEVERSTAVRGLMNWVRLHEHNIAQKVQVVVEHYRATVQPLLEGRAKAMVVVGSRLEAVRWQVALGKYIRERGYALRSLVAFSGEVRDSETGPDPFTETSEPLNPELRGRDIREAFKEAEYQLLLVANKFQTGFDQPLLCGMYIDRRLAGIQAVQTLSRLNRAHPGKDETYVLDFVNDPAEILAAFKTYYTTAELSDVTDPSLILNLSAKLEAQGHYEQNEMDRVVTVVLNQGSKQRDLEAALTPVADRLLRKFQQAKEEKRAAEARGDQPAAAEANETLEALLLYRTDLGTYVRAYSFLSQIFDYRDTWFEKRAIFYRHLVRLLKFEREREGVDLSEVVLTHHRLTDKGQRNLGLSGGDGPKLDPLQELGGGRVHERERVLLGEIIEQLNKLFGSETTEGDQLSYARALMEKTLESELLQKQAANNTLEQFATSPDLNKELVHAVMDSMEAQQALSTQALNSELVREGLKRILLHHLGLYEKLRKRAAGV